jgi:sporulation protein YlmC with PRC-barrel domain
MTQELHEPRAKNPSTGAAGPDPRHGPGPHLMGCVTLVGNDVCNLAGESLGDLKDIMIDMRSGSVSYAVLSFGAFMGMGGKLFAVPWAALKLDTDKKRFVLDVDKTRLDKAPGFDKQNWPDMADPTWQAGIDSYYGVRPDGSPPQVIVQRQ